MNNDMTTLKGRILICVLGAGLLAGFAAWAREPFTEKELADQKAKLLIVVDRGRDLWHGSNPSMSSNGLACGNCHPDAAAANPQTFPKFITPFNKVVAFTDMVNWCIQNPQAGKPLDVSGDDMLAMQAYAFQLYRGEPIEPGLASRQTKPIAVKSGVGYPKKGSGVGVDQGNGGEK
jgi:thiosulfate dehydrogenase